MPQNEKDLENIQPVFEKNADTVYRLCYLFSGSKEQAKENTQKTFLKYIAAQKKFQEEKEETAWLLATAAELCSRPGAKAKQTRNALLPGVAEYPGNAILDALLELSDGEKAVAYLYYYEGYSTMEIAQYLRSSPSKIRGLLAQCRSYLKECLGGEEE